MSVRKREWKTRKGEERSAWVVDYVDDAGDRHIETFAKKREADARHAEVKTDIRDGTHVAPSKSITVGEAGDAWIEAAEKLSDPPLTRSTLDQYRQHLRIHIKPHIGKVKLSGLTQPRIRKFDVDLADNGVSTAMRRKVLTSLVQLIGEAQGSGQINRNVARGAVRRQRSKKVKLKAGVDFPKTDEIKAFVGALEGRWRPLFITAIFTGMRASEIRGLAWEDVDLAGSVIHVRRRADKYNEMDVPKSEAGQRTIPVPPIVINTLREWKVKCPKGDLGLVFPSETGAVQNHSNIRRYALIPLMEKAEIVDGTGVPKYTGMHAFRHFYASWLINPTDRGGLGLPPKVVQERLGHANIAITMDTYGHLFPSGDDTRELEEAQKALLA